MAAAALSVMAGLAAVMAAAPAFAQSSIPRTADGRPDLQGYWVSEFLTPLERPDEFTTLVIPPEKEAEAIKIMTPAFGEVYDPELDYFFPTTLLSVNGELRSSTIIEPENGKLPTTALARAAAKGFKRDFDGPENRPEAERCVGGVVAAPLSFIGNLVPNMIIQTPDAIVFASEDMNPVRIAPIGGDETPEAIRTRSGTSRARWEGDTLVVETSGLRVDHPSGIGWRGEAMVTEDSRVIERFTLVSPDEIHFQFTIEDPALFTKPWLAEYPVYRTTRAMQEYACHEGNHGMMNILSAARMGRQEEPKAD